MLQPQGQGEEDPLAPLTPGKDSRKPVDPGDMRPDIDPDELDIHKPV